MVLEEGEEFDVEVANMASWLADQHRVMSTKMILSAEPEKLEQQFDIHEVREIVNCRYK